MVISSGSAESNFCPDQLMLKVSGDTLGRHPRNSSENVQLLHPPVDQFEERGKELSGTLYSNL